MEPSVRATRDGRERTFLLKIWNILPDHKFGWREVVTETPPAAVVQNMQKTTAPVVEPQKKRGRKKKA